MPARPDSRPGKLPRPQKEGKGEAHCAYVAAVSSVAMRTRL